MNSEMDTAGEHADSNVSFEEAWHFMIKVGLAAHQYGCTATRLELFLVGLSNYFGYEGVFSSTPTDIIFAMREKPDVPQRVEIVATPAPDMNLDKLARLGDLLNEYREGMFPIAEAYTRMDAIRQEPPAWGPRVIMAGYVSVGAGLAPLLGGGWLDTLFASLFSVLVYGLVLLSGRLGASAVSWMPLSTAFVVGVLSTVLKHWIPELNLVLVILSAVAMLLPGYTISLGAGELVAQHVVSGTANLMSGLVRLIKQIAGGWLGIASVSCFLSIPAGGSVTAVAPVWLWLLVPILLIGLCLVFQTSRRDLPWTFLVCAIAYLGIMAGSTLLNATLGNLFGTIIAVISANLWARRTGRPTSIVLIPAIVLLVSGSIGFRGLASMAGGEVQLGVQQFFQMFVVALTIFSGILIGHSLIRPETSL
jgi:uncharacterized membrane protein YjjP (DUF1212 family)